LSDLVQQLRPRRGLAALDLAHDCDNPFVRRSSGPRCPGLADDQAVDLADLGTPAFLHVLRRARIEAGESLFEILTMEAAVRAAGIEQVDKTWLEVKAGRA
jgi:hypothetical protein